MDQAMLCRGGLPGEGMQALTNFALTASFSMEVWKYGSMEVESWKVSEV
jgi:hypothetical protein